MMKKHLALLLVLVTVIAAFSACAKNNTAEETTVAPVTEQVSEIADDTVSFKLSYTQSDSLDPFEATTLNNQVLQNLVFESLFILDEGYEAQPQLASSYSYEDSETLIVTIPSGMEFSNGEKIDADTVVSCFNKAKNSPRWKRALTSIASANADSATVIRFRLKWANPLAHNLLTFAIAANGTDENGYPIGSGRYQFGEGDGDVYLEVNKNHEGFAPHFVRIPLVNITSGESIENAINIGNISYAFRDMASGTKNKMQCSKKAVNMNNLVYIGVNCKKGITADENIRKAISLAVDRDTLVKSAYRGYAKSATSIFNPASQLGRETEIFSPNADLTAARQAIASSGVDESDLKIDILTSNSEGKSAAALLIKQQLETVGFQVTINEEKPSKYEKAVFSDSFNIYIGEVKLSNDMSLLSFFSKNGWTAAGIDLAASNAYSSYWGYTEGENEIGKFVLDFSKEMPFIPLLYRQGMICYSKSMHGDMQGYENNYFSNIEDWYYN